MNVSYHMFFKPQRISDENSFESNRLSIYVLNITNILGRKTVVYSIIFYILNFLQIGRLHTSEQFSRGTLNNSQPTYKYDYTIAH